MKTLFAFLILTSVGFSQGTYIFDSIQVQSQYRKFRLYVPASYTGQAVPLILNFHGYTSNSQQQLLYTNFAPIADTARFIIAYPEGTPDIYNNLFFNAGLVNGPPDDVLFTSQLVQHIKSIYNIDSDRIYSCGMSNGGFMSYYLSCMLPNTFAAIGSVTGSNFVNWFSCQPGRVFPVMQIHGTNDATVPYAGSSTMSPIDSVINKYRVICGLPNTPQTYSFANTSFTDNCTAVSYRYVNSQGKIMVELIKVFGGGHTWPGGSVYFPGTCYDFSASAELWRFFRQHKLSDYVATSVIDNAIDKDSPLVFPNPFRNSIYVEKDEIRSVVLTDVQGKHYLFEVKDGKADVSDLTPGVYLIRFKVSGKEIIRRLVCLPD